MTTIEVVPEAVLAAAAGLDVTLKAADESASARDYHQHSSSGILTASSIRTDDASSYSNQIGGLSKTMKRTEVTDSKKTGSLMLGVLHQIEMRIPIDAVGVIKELVEHNEEGVALETICSQIFECGIELSIEQKIILKDVAFLLAIPLAQLDGLSE